MYKLCFFVPEDAADRVKTALFSAGAGRIGAYDQCCWQTLGQGQFRPLAGSNPTIGMQNQLETVAELKVEMVCDDSLIKPAIKALKSAHPYEEPAYEAWRIEEL